MTASAAVAVLFALLPSFVAPVEPVSVLEPTETGVPETVHVITAPAATSLGTVGEQIVLKPAGRPLSAHVADVAVAAGDAAFVHVNVPL